MGQLLVNLGCGSITHESWRNFDVEPSSPEVEYLDVRRGVPIAPGTCDAVYHSHVMEHLIPEEGQKLLGACCSLLKPGGIVRVVVPDLEGIAREYVSVLDKLAAGGDPLAENDHEWITLELLDQMVRDRSGGMMAEYWRRETIPNEEFLRRRMGWQFTTFRDRVSAASASAAPRKGPGVRKLVQKLRQKAASVIVRTTCGRAAGAAFQESLFRAEGEVHRWMYDRFSLSRLLLQSGFDAPRVVGFDESGIGGFAGFGLDSWEGEPRKPDSLYMEARKAS